MIISVQTFKPVDEFSSYCDRKRQLARNALAESIGQVIDGTPFGREGFSRGHGEGQLEELVHRSLSDDHRRRAALSAAFSGWKAFVLEEGIQCKMNVHVDVFFKCWKYAPGRRAERSFVEHRANEFGMGHACIRRIDEKGYPKKVVIKRLKTVLKNLHKREKKMCFYHFQRSLRDCVLRRNERAYSSRIRHAKHQTLPLRKVKIFGGKSYERNTNLLSVSLAAKQFHVLSRNLRPSENANPIQYPAHDPAWKQWGPSVAGRTWRERRHYWQHWGDTRTFFVKFAELLSNLKERDEYDRFVMASG
ncbi:hypothetical protein BJ742DRAFT_737718 [Cladochytrium replicatum]|nr:hypothetical protein BJ742DRAFT_737718 [Cladochytrium replicatum]